MIALHPSLKAACAGLHAEVDALFSRFDLCDAEDYSRFLQAHATVVLPLEAALDRAGMARCLPDWSGRRRAALLSEDLLLLQQALPAPALLPDFTEAAQCWGAAYVLEGSKLGGAVLARRLPAGVPCGYLRAPATAPSWPVFLAALQAAVPERALATLTASARATFTLFKEAAQHHLEAPVA